MKLLIKLFFLLFVPVFATAQFLHKQLDSMHLVLKNAANDTIRMDAYYKLGIFYDDVNLDSFQYYSEKGISIAKQLRLKLNEAEMLMNVSFPLTKTGNYPQSFKVLTQALEIAEDPASEKNTWRLKKGQTPLTYRLSVSGYTRLGFGYLYAYTGNYEKRITTYIEGIRLAVSINDTLLLSLIYGDMSNAYNSLNKLDSALFFGQKALEYFSLLPFEERKFEGDVFSGIGGIHLHMGNLNLARENFEKAIQISEEQNNPALSGEAYLQLANLYQTIKKADSSLFYGKKALEAFESVGKEKAKAVAYRMISDFYGDQKNADSSFAYLRLAAVLNDSLDRVEKRKLQEFQVAGFNEQLRLQELEKEKIQTQNNIRTYAMLAGLAVFLSIGLILYRNNRQKQKVNRVLESTLTNLKATQSQLIQSEKMASLGELTAGIAHEIQNPLNFINNFSDVNKELLGEMKEEIDKGNLDEVKTIANDVIENEEKINHHGKRADVIVKGMLQHSRASSGQKEPTDINALAEEYLRLSYHGMRAKDKSFNAIMQSDFDKYIGKISIIPQDIGRVLLNLYNNAFHSMMEKKKSAFSKAGEDEYEPTLSVVTRKLGGKVIITVKDNGTGIPDKIKDKIFQPFFTTKPAGSGTGLGLSLSYDIITKEHGGEIKVESRSDEVTGKEGGAKFIASLPA